MLVTTNPRTVPGTHKFKDMTALLLLFVIVTVTGVRVLEKPCKPEVLAAPSLLCVLASKGDSPD